MKFFTDCSGICAICAYGEHCLAGHGDDHFVPADKEQIISRLDNNRFSSFRKDMIDYLKHKFEYNYDS